MSLFDLAHYAAVTPPQVNSLTVTDFAQLLSGIRQYKTARAAPGQP